MLTMRTVNWCFDILLTTLGQHLTTIWGSRQMNSANAGYAVTGSGGGGTDGNYMFASIEELDSLVDEWLALRERIFERGRRIVRARDLIEPPARDPMSREHANVIAHSMAKALAHNDAMRTYTKKYIAKLTMSRDQYTSDDNEAAVSVRNIGES